MIDADHVAKGQAALAAGKWAEARARFEAALDAAESADAHEGLGAALWWLCEPRASVRHRERAFVLLRQAGEHAGACTVAVNLVITYLVNLGNEPAARGWLARGESLRHHLPSGSPAPGWLLLMRGYVERDPARGRASLEAALAYARTVTDVDLELVALADLGVSYVAEGQVERGMGMLDEAMAATMGGERQCLETVVYNCCSMLMACHLAGDLERAAQWCRAAEDFMESISCPFLFARCRVHYGSLLYAKGRWDRAERELQAAAELAADVGPGPREEALARLAELRIHQGRLEEAEALLDRCDQLGQARVPAAALRLARGDAKSAVGLLRHRQPGGDGTDDVDALVLLVEAHLASGDLASAVDAAAALEQLGPAERSPTSVAAIGRASALVLLARGERAAAAGLLGRAVDTYSNAELPYEESVARLDLARALASEQAAIAGAEAKNALRAFERIGATAKAAETAALLRSLGMRVARLAGADACAPLTTREREVLELVCAGLSNPEIAGRLFISRKTAAHHVSSILAKLGVRNRVELAAYSPTAAGPSSRSHD